MVTYILGSLPKSKNGNMYVLVTSDYFTSWAEAYAIPNQEAETFAKKLTNEMFCWFSIPEQLHLDQGRQFESKLVSEMCKVLKICKTRTTPYHPQGDGLVERFNRTLISMLATATADDSLDWEECLPKVCFAYNTSVRPIQDMLLSTLCLGDKPNRQWTSCMAWTIHQTLSSLNMLTI